MSFTDFTKVSFWRVRGELNTCSLILELLVSAGYPKKRRSSCRTNIHCGKENNAHAKLIHSLMSPHTFVFRNRVMFSLSFIPDICLPFLLCLCLFTAKSQCAWWGNKCNDQLLVSHYLSAYYFASLYWQLLLLSRFRNTKFKIKIL